MAQIHIIVKSSRREWKRKPVRIVLICPSFDDGFVTRSVTNFIIYVGIWIGISIVIDSNTMASIEFFLDQFIH